MVKPNTNLADLPQIFDNNSFCESTGVKAKELFLVKSIWRCIALAMAIPACLPVTARAVDKVRDLERSAGFQPAVSPISNRQGVFRLVVPANSARPQAGSTAIQQVGNLRYSPVVKGAAPEAALTTNSSREHWAFQPIRRPDPPPLRNSNAKTVNPIDRFILAKLQAKGLSFSQPASKATLIRRVTFDLIGLPPTVEEIDAFVKDTSATAYEKLIDRLLDSPHYGERWGRHWLDLARYAESDGFEHDAVRPHAWRYRDYVIRAFNEDKPYDRFIREQLAGDELEKPNDDAIIATGFYRLGIWDDEPADKELARYDGLDDIVTTVGQVFLGLTVDCARCHN